MTDAKELLSPDLTQKVEDAARTENRKPADLVQDAVKQCLDRRSWVDSWGGMSATQSTWA